MPLTVTIIIPYLLCDSRDKEFVVSGKCFCFKVQRSLEIAREA